MRFRSFLYDSSCSRILFDGIENAFHPSSEAQGVIARIEIGGSAASARIDANDRVGLLLYRFFPSSEYRGQMDRGQQDLPPARRSLRTTY